MTEDETGLNGDPTTPGADPFQHARDLGDLLLQPQSPEQAQGRLASRYDPDHLRELQADRADPKYAFTDNIFGESTLAQIDAKRAEFGTDDPAVTELLSSSRWHLEFELEYSPKHYQTFLEELGQSEQADVLGTYTGPPDDPANISRGGRGHVMDLNQYELFLRSHVEKTKAAMEQRQPDIDRMKESFIDRLTSSIESGVFPISLEEAKRRLNDAKIAFADPAYNILTRGHFDYQLGKIVINPFLADEQLQRVIDHEFMHAISGVTAQVGSLTPNGERNVISRQGISTEFSSKSGFKFSWLDEAITEQAAMQLRGETNDSGNTTYAPGRKLLELLTRCVDLPAFYKAYFEDFDPKTGTPATDALYAALEKQIEPRILYTLDALIQGEEDTNTGLNKAIAYLEERAP